jgi:hypothetical protein
MPRAKLPPEFQELLPNEIVMIIHSYVPYPKKQKSQEVSPSLQKELMRIQTKILHGKTGMYMKDFTDFCLD